MSDVSRRSVLRVGAWGVPVLAVAVAAPAAAASIQTVPLVTTQQLYPAIRTIEAAVIVTNPTSETLTITVTVAYSPTTVGAAYRNGWSSPARDVYMITLAAGASSTPDGLYVNASAWQTGAPSPTEVVLTVFANAPGLSQGSQTLTAQL
ncbi:hypothetical protein SCB71_10575 [Herbiconiux sp. KACC 21604]|uniref:hypothetical protein n=1 Tax=unclassified Herbiconiux TaxID=2618217 RepID=UPI00149223F7|nr:hypothetical protein [Herbiconiux sp. SALV-R1]QJU53674.1 hypothetical protein HL652_08525 [Herbiconiux sp. SALV-R1]WPO84677.1 hypothetical protein SCB71_10575 [Herbiconiux sp. KACC 21604]